MNKSKIVLVVCMIDSIHTARWLKMFEKQSIHFILFPSTPNRKIHPVIKDLMEKNDINHATLTLNFFLRRLAIPLWGIDLFVSNRLRGWLLSRLSKKYDVDYVHAMELNHAGYIVNRAYDYGLPISSKIISSNWGSDIYWFQQYNKHEKLIRKLLHISNYYSAECSRDLDLAIKYGFNGKFKEVLPTAGGFDEWVLKKCVSEPSTRNLVLIKGYESFVGRASLALDAVVTLQEKLRDNYKVVVYSANLKTLKKIRKIQRETNLEIVAFPKKHLSHNQMLDLFSNSRVYVGVSLSDGISTSLLEALVSGTFPIQTNTSCASEWIVDGISGFIVDPNVGAIVNAIERALKDDQLVDNAKEINCSIANKKLDNQKLKNKLINFYSD